MTHPTFRARAGACAAMLLALWPLAASAAEDDAPPPARPAPLALRVRWLELDTYLDRGRGLVVLTDGCQEPAVDDTAGLLRPRPDSNAPELAFPSGEACPVTFVGGDNVYLQSGADGEYTDVVSGQTLRTADCPDLPAVEPALVRFDRVILLGGQPRVCHLAA
jgi:hypothetical protein